MDNKMKSTRDAYGEVLVELGKSDKNVVVLDADVSKATRTNKFAKEFPDRFFNCGCAEQNMIGVAAGLSLTGKIPFVSTFAVFAACRALDQIRNTICYPKLNVKIVATHGGITVGADGPSHQSIEDIAIMRVIPNMTVIVPADAADARKAIKASANFPGPVYIRLGRASVPMVTKEDTPYQIGKATILANGSDAAIITCGIMVAQALEAAKLLSQDGIEAMIINMHTIKPLDKETVLKVSQQVKVIVTVEEHSTIGGLGSAVAECISEDVSAAIGMVGLRDTFAESGDPCKLLIKYKLTPEEIVRKVKSLLGNR